MLLRRIAGLFARGVACRRIGGGGCVDDGDLAFADRSFYVAHMAMMLIMVLPSPTIYVIVTGSSFAPLFPEWHALCQAVQALLFAAALTGTTFFVDRVPASLNANPYCQ